MTHRKLSNGKLALRRTKIWKFLQIIFWNLEFKISFFKVISTVTSFFVAILAVPLFIILFIISKLCEKLVLIWATKTIDGVTDVTKMMARDSLHPPKRPGLVTLLLRLEGSSCIQNIRNKIKNDLVDRVGCNNQPLHPPHFQQRLVKILGYYAWKKHPEFDIKEHVILVTANTEGKLVTYRNIQEVVSAVCSTQLPVSLPPWQIVVIAGFGENGEPVTWAVLRAHHLLSNLLRITDLTTSYPDYWRLQSYSKGIPLLTAPAASVRLWKAFITFLNEALTDRILNLCKAFFVRTYDELQNVVTFIQFKFKYEGVVWRSESLLLLRVLALIDSTFRLPLAYSLEYFEQKVVISVFSIIRKILVQSLVICCLILKTIILFMYGAVSVTCEYLLQKEQSKVGLLCFEACCEVWCMAKAIACLPRLFMEEFLATRGEAPLKFWKAKGGFNDNGGFMVSWSESVPLSCANGIKKLTGASISSILLTAVAGAVRDLIRACGILAPDNLRCTLPLYNCSSKCRTFKSPGLLPISLPTGATDALSALKRMRHSLQSIHKYPERYLASVWLLRNASHLLPWFLLKIIMKRLAEHHPIMLTNFVGPDSALSIWGQQLTSIMYFRPPQNPAVLSLCISSYCGRVTMGLIADDWAISYASKLPQSFVSHFNELAVDIGVKLERQSSRFLTRSSSSSSSSPSSTPPSTPRSPAGISLFLLSPDYLYGNKTPDDQPRKRHTTKVRRISTLL